MSHSEANTKGNNMVHQVVDVLIVYVLSNTHVGNKLNLKELIVKLDWSVL